MIHPSSVAVSREHRRAKTDRLDTELLKRGFLGWLRGERGHCSMARVPTIAEEDAKRPNRERECLVGERTRIVNRMKGTLARLGIRNFKPTLRKAAERLATLHTPEGSPLPANVLAELQRDIGRLRFVVSQIREIEEARQKRLEQSQGPGHTPWSGFWLESSESALKQQICSSMRCSRGGCVIAKRWRVSPVLLAPRARVAPSGGSKGSPKQATPGCGAE